MAGSIQNKRGTAPALFSQALVQITCMSTFADLRLQSIPRCRAAAFCRGGEASAWQRARGQMNALLEARFAPEHLIEFRCIRAGRVQRTWARCSQVQVIDAKLRRLDAEGWDIYASVNPRAAARSNEASVTELVAFHVDIDELPAGADHGGHCFAVARTQQKNEKTETPEPGAVTDFSLPCVPLGVKRRMEASADPIPEPSMIVSSGHGLHCYFVLGAPVSVSEANRDHLKSINRGLAKALGGDSACSDLSRVLRVPAFHNHKTNPPREVTILSETSIRYTLEQLAPFAAKAATFTRDVSVPPAAVAPIAPELEQRFKAVRRRDGEISRAFRGEIGDGSSDSRYVLVMRLRQHGFSPEEIVAIVCSRRWYNRRTKRVRPTDSVLRDVRGLLVRSRRT